MRIGNASGWRKQRVPLEGPGGSLRQPPQTRGTWIQQYLGMVKVYSIHGKLLGVLQEVDFCFPWSHAPKGERGITGGHGKSLGLRPAG